MTNRRVKVNGKEYSMDGYVQDNLDIVKKVIKSDWDFVYIIDGKEGAGKSAFAQQLAYYLTDGHFDIDDIVFNVHDFIEKVRNQTKHRAVIWDEAYVGINGGSALSSLNKEVTRLLMECRQKNLFIFIVMPTFWDLSKYAKLHRANGVWHVHTSDTMQRGYFRYYKNGAIKTMERQNSKYKYDHPTKYKSFYGRFPKGYMVDEAEYLKKKEISFKANIEEKEAKNPIGRSTLDWKEYFMRFICHVKAKGEYNYQQIADISGTNYSSLKNSAQQTAQKIRDNGVDVGKFPPQQRDVTL